MKFYFNGHNELARKLEKNDIAYTMLDNAFVQIDDADKAQKLAHAIRPDRLHKRLDQVLRAYCPIVRHFRSGYHWSIMQVEYATDIVFKRQKELAPIYEELVRTAIHSVKPDHVATFLGRKLTANFEDEVGNDFHTRIEGTRIKHHMGKAAIKMYDKQGIVLRIEITSNDVSFFKHYRKVAVVLITGYPDSDLVAEALTFGPTTLLAKPVDPMLLTSTIWNALNGQNRQNQWWASKQRRIGFRDPHYASPIQFAPIPNHARKRVQGHQWGDGHRSANTNCCKEPLILSQFPA